MNLTETLTKENFWNEINSTYPNACKLFCDWIDEYKAAVDWENVFNGGIIRVSHLITKSPKFHEIPYAMQQGIWIEFATEKLNEYFEQPEYQYVGDLREDIKAVFTELEMEISD